MTYPITRFLSETGIQSLPSLETWQEVTSNQSDLAINSTFLLHREHSENQLTAMMYVGINEILRHQSISIIFLGNISKQIYQCQSQMIHC